MLEGISILVLLLWICSRKSVLAFLFHQLQQIFQMKYFFQLNILKLFISNFWFFHFSPVTQEKDGLQRMMTLSNYHENNQDSIYELVLFI